MTRKDRAERRARILFEAAEAGDDPAADKKICKKHGIALRTLQIWRQQFNAGSDPDLAQKIASGLKVRRERFLSEMPGALRTHIKLLTEAGRKLDPSKPEDVLASKEAFLALATVLASWRVLEVKLAQMQAPPAPVITAPPSNVVPFRPLANGTNGAPE